MAIESDSTSRSFQSMEIGGGAASGNENQPGDVDKKLAGAPYSLSIAIFLISSVTGVHQFYAKAVKTESTLFTVYVWFAIAAICSSILTIYTNLILLTTTRSPIVKKLMTLLREILLWISIIFTHTSFMFISCVDEFTQSIIMCAVVYAGIIVIGILVLLDHYRYVDRNSTAIDRNAGTVYSTTCAIFLATATGAIHQFWGIHAKDTSLYSIYLGFACSAFGSAQIVMYTDCSLFIIRSSKLRGLLFGSRTVMLLISLLMMQTGFCLLLFTNDQQRPGKIAICFILGLCYSTVVCLIAMDTMGNSMAAVNTGLNKVKAPLERGLKSAKKGYRKLRAAGGWLSPSGRRSPPV